jgi:hypothetical protein
MTVRFLMEHYLVGFTKLKVQRVVNLFEGTGSVCELNYLAKISRSCFRPLWKNESIQYNKLRPNVVFNFVSVCKVSKINVKYVTCVFASAATFNTFFSFFLQTRRL